MMDEETPVSEVLHMADEKGNMAFGIFSLAAICGVIFGVARFQHAHTQSISDLQGQRITHLEVELSKIVVRMEHDDIRERADAATLAHLASEATSEQKGIADLYSQILNIRAWSQDHDLRVIERNSRQDTLLKVLMNDRNKP